MSEPNWVDVLSVVYHQEGITDFPLEMESGIAEDNIIVMSTGLTPSEVKKAVSHLHVNGLLEYDGNPYHMGEEEDEGVRMERRIDGVALTEKGFNVAHERELRDRQYELSETQKDASKTLADFTIILGVTALIQALAAIVSAPEYNIPLASIYLVLLGALWYKREDWFYRV